MANKKKTETDEVKSAKKKSVTKVNTTRTKKIIAKTKTASKKIASSKTAKTAKKTTIKKETKPKAVKATKSKTSTTKKSATKKETKTTAKKKTTTTKKSPAKKATTTRKTRSKKAVKNDEITANTNLTEEFNSSEYYDLPFTYNKTIVKILAQTPEILFVYWDISEEDRKNYIKQYGENFFYDTKPVLIITNKTMNYTFEVDINDFANSWYLHVNDAKSEYHIELGRRPISNHIDIPNNYISVASSNVIENQNDHILFEKEQKMIYFKNIKTNIITEKPITTLSFLNNMGRIYNIYDIYHKLFKDENFEDASKLMGHS